MPSGVGCGAQGLTVYAFGVFLMGPGAVCSCIKAEHPYSPKLENAGTQVWQNKGQGAGGKPGTGQGVVAEL